MSFALVLLTSCSHIKVDIVPCLTEAPPQPTATLLTPCPLEHPELVACLDRPGTVGLVKTLEHQRMWMDEAWTRCGPVPNP